MPNGKSLAETGKLPTRGMYLQACEGCGQIVVHSGTTDEPLHMHRNSIKCRQATNMKRVHARPAST